MAQEWPEDIEIQFQQSKSAEEIRTVMRKLTESHLRAWKIDLHNNVGTANDRALEEGTTPGGYALACLLLISLIDQILEERKNATPNNPNPSVPPSSMC